MPVLDCGQEKSFEKPDPRGKQADRRRQVLPQGTVSAAEQPMVKKPVLAHDRAETGDDRAYVRTHGESPMTFDVPSPHMVDGGADAEQHPKRQQMDGTEAEEDVEAMEPERGDRHHRKCEHPGPAERAMRRRALHSGELDDARHQDPRRRNKMYRTGRAKDSAHLSGLQPRGRANAKPHRD